ncbi:unnamed protein product, partial [Symbiodinium pilosum]
EHLEPEISADEAVRVQDFIFDFAVTSSTSSSTPKRARDHIFEISEIIRSVQVYAFRSIFLFSSIFIIVNTLRPILDAAPAASSTCWLRDDGQGAPSTTDLEASAFCADPCVHREHREHREVPEAPGVMVVTSGRGFVRAVSVNPPFPLKLFQFVGV